MEKYGRAGQVTGGIIIMAHALCMLGNYGYRHTRRISNTCVFFSTATMVWRTRLSVTFMPILPVLFTYKISRYGFCMLSLMDVNESFNGTAVCLLWTEDVRYLAGHHFG